MRLRRKRSRLVEPPNIRWSRLGVIRVFFACSFGLSGWVHAGLVLSSPWRHTQAFGGSGDLAGQAKQRQQRLLVFRLCDQVIRWLFSEKALIELEADSLTELDVAESILNAVAIYKTLRSRSLFRQQRIEYLHVIQSTNLDGLMIYTKGKLVEEAGIERYYFLISCKKAL
jgi:hypothetical protein